MSDNLMDCCLCDGKILPQIGGWDKGHNASPIKEGRCCSDCNDNKVIPHRISMYYMSGKMKKS